MGKSSFKKGGNRLLRRRKERERDREREREMEVSMSMFILRIHRIFFLKFISYQQSIKHCCFYPYLERFTIMFTLSVSFLHIK